MPKYTLPANLPLSISPLGDLLVRKQTGAYINLSDCDFGDRTLGSLDAHAVPPYQVISPLDRLANCHVCERDTKQVRKGETKAEPVGYWECTECQQRDYASEPAENVTEAAGRVQDKPEVKPKKTPKKTKDA